MIASSNGHSNANGNGFTPPCVGLRLRGLRKAFGAVRAVDGADLELRAGGTCSVLGPSGCGKTTTLRLIAGLERPDAGEIVVGGRVVSSPDRFVPAEQRRIGMVFQDYALFPHMDVAGNVGYGLGRKPDSGRIREALELVGLAGSEKRPVHELSGGQQQRVAVARALVTEPAMILADEPTGNLDSTSTADVLELFEELNSEGRTIVLITHEHDIAARAQRTIQIRDGRIWRPEDDLIHRSPVEMAT
jgi:iron(III) transport system ATP-binding protein